jgi:hypothetical protein
MPPVGFEPTISVLERAKTFHALDRTATVIGSTYTTTIPILDIIHRLSNEDSFSGTGVCLRLQVVPTELSQIDGAGTYLLRSGDMD